MIGCGLARELDTSIAAMTDAHRKELVGRGVAASLLAPPCPMVGTMRVRVFGDTWQPDESGSGVYVTPVIISGPLSPEATDPASVVRGDGDLVDLVAWRPDRPDRCATRCGAAEWLGAIEPQYCAPAPVQIWRSPLNWLRAGCRGLVPLTADPAEIWHMLTGCRGGIVAEDDRHAAQLRRVLARPWPAPQVWPRSRALGGA